MRLPERDLRYIAVALPDEVRMYHYAGDFEGEVRCIDRFLAREIPVCLRKKLTIQRMTAVRLQDDYPLTRGDVVRALRERCPAADESTLDAFLASGNVDFILKDGAMRFQRRAVANMFRTHARELGFPDGPPAPADPPSRRTEDVMREAGGRAFRFEVEERASLAPDAERVGRTLRLWFPYPVACASQPEAEIRLLSSSHPARITGTALRSVYMETPCERAGVYAVRFSFVNRAPYTDLSRHRPTGLPAGEGLSRADLLKYTSEQPPHILFTPFIRALAEEIRGDETDPLRLARRVYDRICASVRYSYVRDYLLIENLPESVLLNGYGDCGGMALAFLTLCRCLGVPAKWQSGSVCRPDRIGSHDWAMFHVAPYGWLYCDPSFGAGAAADGDEVRRNHFFGNLDPFRLVACNEFQEPLSPEQRLCRLDPYDNQNGEAEYADAERPLLPGQYAHARRVISSEELPWRTPKNEGKEPRP